MPKVITVPGIHATMQNEGIEGMILALNQQGLDVYPFHYGFAYAVTTALLNPGRAKKLAALVEPGDVIMGHSNGCDLGWRAAMLGAPIAGLVLINPALKPDIEFSPQVQWVRVYYNKGDEVVPWANKLFLFDHSWGAMGRDGYTGTDKKVQSVDCGTGPYPANGHSDIFTPGKIDYWAKYIALEIASHKPNTTANGLT